MEKEKKEVVEETPVQEEVKEAPIEEEINEEALNSEEPKKLSRKEKRREKLRQKLLNPNDIKYQGPLSYRYLKIIAWIAIAIGQVAVINALVIRFLTIVS